MFTRRVALVVFVVTAFGAALPAAEPLVSTDAEGVRWFDIRQLGVEGQGWSDVKAPYDRFPAKAEATLRDAVWSLSRHSAGMCVRFVTNSTAIRTRWTLTSDRLAMPHMAATGVSGLDLYARDESGRRALHRMGQGAVRRTRVSRRRTASRRR